MVFVRSDPNRTSGLPGPPPYTGFSDPVLSTVCPYSVPASCFPHLPDSFFAFRFSPFAARSGGSANPVGLLFRGQRPDHPRRPVGERHRDQHLRLTCQHPGQPRIRDLTASDDRHGPSDQEASQVSLAQRTADGTNHGRESSNYLQGCTICAFCPWTASAPVVQKQRGNRLNSRESRSPHSPLHYGLPRAVTSEHGRPESRQDIV